MRKAGNHSNPRRSWWREHGIERKMWGWRRGSGRATRPPSAPYPGSELVPATPHDATWTLSARRGAGGGGQGGPWVHMEGFSWLQEACKSWKAGHSLISSSRGTLALYSYLLPSPNPSLCLLATHPGDSARPSLTASHPKAAEETWPARTGTQDPSALRVRGSSSRGHVGSSGRARKRQEHRSQEQHGDRDSQDPGMHRGRIARWNGARGKGRPPPQATRGLGQISHLSGIWPASPPGP